MALSKGKARDRRGEKKWLAERISERGIPSRVGLTRRKRANTPRRRLSYDSVSLPQLIYELLTIDKCNEETSGRCRERYGTPRRGIQRYYNRQRFPYKMAEQRDSPESVHGIPVPEYTVESRPTSVESLMESMDAVNSSAPISSANSSISNISMEPITLVKSLNNARALFRKKSLVQLINSYIKAGIEEGKRRAKQYIRKALSFGVRSGYLIPADPQGNVLRVCSTLDTGSCIESTRTSDAESRRRRRIARRGERRLATIDDRKAMRRGILRDKWRQATDGEQLSGLKKRQEKHLAQNRVKSLSTIGSSPRRSPQKTSLRAKNKPKTETRRKRIDDTTENKRQQQRKRGIKKDIKKPVKRPRTNLSPSRDKNDQDEAVEESYRDVNRRDRRDQYKGNEDSYRTVAERRKSESSQGNESDKGIVETNIIEDNHVTERGNVDDNDEKSEGASVERDTSDIIREIDA